MRVYVPVSRDHLRRLADTGVLPADGLVTSVPEGADEKAEDEAMAAAAELADEQWGEHLAVAADVPSAVHGEALVADVPLRDVASFAVGEDLAWYATQELPELL